MSDEQQAEPARTPVGQKAVLSKRPPLPRYSNLTVEADVGSVCVAFPQVSNGVAFGVWLLLLCGWGVALIDKFLCMDMGHLVEEGFSFLLLLLFGGTILFFLSKVLRPPWRVILVATPDGLRIGRSGWRGEIIGPLIRAESVRGILVTGQIVTLIYDLERHTFSQRDVSADDAAWLGAFLQHVFGRTSSSVVAGKTVTETEKPVSRDGRQTSSTSADFQSVPVVEPVAMTPVGMKTVVTCPNCSAGVVVKVDGTCPACQSAIDEGGTQARNPSSDELEPAIPEAGGVFRGETRGVVSGKPREEKSNTSQNGSWAKFVFDVMFDGSWAKFVFMVLFALIVLIVQALKSGPRDSAPPVLRTRSPGSIEK